MQDVEKGFVRLTNPFWFLYYDKQQPCQKHSTFQHFVDVAMGNKGTNMGYSFTHLRWRTSLYNLSFENNYGYHPTTSYIHNFEDEAGNVIIKKTTKDLNEYTYSDDGYTVHELIKCDLTGTVKEHSEYKGIKQTILTRCKIDCQYNIIREDNNCFLWCSTSDNVG